MTKYDDYIKVCRTNVRECLTNMECQPILFIGSGFSKRYFNAPNWNDLLRVLSEKCPKAKKFGYYKQTYDTNIEISTEIANVYKEWAWEEGTGHFPELLFSENQPSDIFIKTEIAEYLKGITPKSLDELEPFKEELQLLKQISPYAIITTNYDNFLELIFPEYTPIIGQKILSSQYTSIGEIYKIHGCITQPNSLVLTNSDYISFLGKKKYLSAKLLTFFLEHPIIFLGYSASDPNIQSILSDIDEILATEGELVPNIYIIDYNDDLKTDVQYPIEKLINLENG